VTRTLLILLAAATAAVAQPQSVLAQAKKPKATPAANFKPAELKKLAVIVTAGDSIVIPKGGPNLTNLQRLVEDAFLECLLAKGYTLAARSDVGSVLQEKSFQESGESKQAAAVGKLLNVPAVLLVRVTDLSGEKQPKNPLTTLRATLSARLVDVENAEMLWNGTHTLSGPMNSWAGAGKVLQRTAVELVEAFPDKAKPVAVRPRLIDPKDVPKLAVVTVSGAQPMIVKGKKQAPEQSDLDRQVEDMFAQVLNEKGYKLVTRSDLKALIQEQAFQMSGLTDDNAVKVGKFLKVPLILLVGVTESTSETVAGAIPYGKTTKQTSTLFARAGVGARLVDVATGEVRWVHAEYEVKQVDGKGGVVDLLADVATAAAKFLPPEPDSAKLLLERATRLELMGQVTAARAEYRELADRYPQDREGKWAAKKLKQ
jgi:hypothetical protein